MRLPPPSQVCLGPPYDDYVRVHEVEGFDDEVEGTAIHGSAHIAASGDDDGPDVGIDEGRSGQETEAVHIGRVNVRSDRADGGDIGETLQSLYAVAGKEEPVLPGADARSHPPIVQQLNVRFVVDYKKLKGPAPLAILNSLLP